LSWSLTFGNNPAGYFGFSESNLPIVIINTNGQAIDVDNKITADMAIVYNGPGIRNHITDTATEYDGKIGIEYRGNYSLSLPQKPYAFEHTRQCGSGNRFIPFGHAGRARLGYYWQTTMTNSFAQNLLSFHLYDTMGHYSVRSRFVDVVMNGGISGYLYARRKDQT